MRSTNLLPQINSHSQQVFMIFSLNWPIYRLNRLMDFFSFPGKGQKGLSTLSTSQPVLSAVFFWPRAIFLCHEELDLNFKVLEQRAGEVRMLHTWSSVQLAGAEARFLHHMAEELRSSIQGTSCLSCLCGHSSARVRPGWEFGLLLTNWVALGKS